MARRVGAASDRAPSCANRPALLHLLAEIYRGLADGYVDDARFSAFYERVKPGLARFMRDAMHVYADRLASAG